MCNISVPFWNYDCQYDTDVAYLVYSYFNYRSLLYRYGRGGYGAMGLALCVWVHIHRSGMDEHGSIDSKDVDL